MLSSCLWLGLHLGVPTKVLCHFLFPHECYRTSHLILLYMLTLIIFVEEYKLCHSSLRSFLYISFPFFFNSDAPHIRLMFDAVFIRLFRTHVNEFYSCRVCHEAVYRPLNRSVLWLGRRISQQLRKHFTHYTFLSRRARLGGNWPFRVEEWKADIWANRNFKYKETER
jgi:hypothetical protein